MIKAIITDLDDTLLRRDKTASDFSIQILNRCREKGIRIIVATARSAYVVKELIPFDIFDGFAVMNGAVAIADNNKVYERLMTPKVFVPILEALNGANIQTAVEINGVHYSNYDVPYRKYAITDFATIKEKSAKLYAIADTQDKAIIVQRLIPAELNVVFTNDNYALITHPEASKINAISAILNFYGISFEETVAFGDDINDIDMIQKCGIGVAMENAIYKVKTVSNEICLDCDNDGVAKWLSERLL